MGLGFYAALIYSPLGQPLAAFGLFATVLVWAMILPVCALSGVTAQQINAIDMEAIAGWLIAASLLAIAVYPRASPIAEFLIVVFGICYLSFWGMNYHGF